MSNFEVKDPSILLYQEHKAQRFHPSSFCGSLFNILRFSFRPSHSDQNGKETPNGDIDLRSLMLGIGMTPLNLSVPARHKSLFVSWLDCEERKDLRQ
jgi:hypothetical protein